MSGSSTIGRREALQRLGALALGSLTLAGIGLGREARRALASEAPVAPLFTTGDVALLDELAETILPATATPGAKAAATGSFVATLVADVLNPELQQIFMDFMQSVDARCAAQYGGDFRSATDAERLALVQEFDREQFEHAGSHAGDAPAHGFRMLKGMVLFGFFTSEIGYTQVLRYAETPGRFDPAAPLAPGETAFAKHASDVGGGRVPGLVLERRQCRAARTA
jgi:hypothetical protein